MEPTSRRNRVGITPGGVEGTFPKNQGVQTLMDFQQLLARLGRTGQAQAAGGLLAFILSFFAWATVTFSISADDAALLRAAGQSVPSDSYSQNAWGSYTGFTAWFPVILLLALGVVAVLVALGTIKPLPMAGLRT